MCFDCLGRSHKADFVALATLFTVNPRNPFQLIPDKGLSKLTVRQIKNAVALNAKQRVLSRGHRAESLKSLQQLPNVSPCHAEVYKTD